MELKEAKEAVERSLGRAVMVEGFEERYFGPLVINTLYYSTTYNDPSGDSMRDYRMEVFIDDRPTLGHILGKVAD